MSILMPVHAACIVTASATPSFLGPGNQGFQPFGPDDADHSFRISVGKYRMRLREPIDFAGGQGICFGGLNGQGPSATLVCIVVWENPNDLRSVMVFTFSGGGTIASDLDFWVVVNQMPQSVPSP